MAPPVCILQAFGHRFQDGFGNPKGKVAVPLIKQIRWGFIGIRIARCSRHPAQRFELKGPQGFNLQAHVCQGINQPFEGLAAGRGLAKANPLIQVLSLLVQPEAKVRAISDSLRQQAPTNPAAGHVLTMIAAILLTRFNDRPISEICAMGGLTLDDFTSSRAYREIFREGEAAGEARGEASVTLRLLNRRCGPLSGATTTTRIQALPLPQLESLVEALLDFSGPADLQAWLEEHG